MDAVVWSQLEPGVLDELFEADLLGLDLGDRYAVGPVLGEGGQGVVVQAEDRACGRQVAVKCAKRSGAHLRAEAELLSRLAHPAIPQVYDLGTTLEGREFVAMQLVCGLRLDAWLAEDPPLEERLRVFLRIADGVDHAHRRDVLHRDLKPSNVVVGEDGEPVILDWGLAAQGGKRSICGSPHFAAPEQLENQPIDRRADVYALGVLLYWLLSGELPYARRVSDFHEFRRVRAGIRLLPLRRRRPDAPRRIERLVQRCMATHPAARPATAEQVAAAVRSVLDGLRERAGHRHAWLVPVAALLIGLAAGWWLARWVGQQGSPSAAADREFIERLRRLPGEQPPLDHSRGDPSMIPFEITDPWDSDHAPDRLREP